MGIIGEVATAVLDTIVPARRRESAYERSVFDGNCDLAIIDAADKVPADWRTDRARLTRWQKAAEMLANLPERQQAADEADAAAQQVAEPLDGSVTIDQIREQVRTIDPKVPAGTAAELAVAFRHLAQHAEQLAERARQARRQAEETESAAVQVLKSLSAKHPDTSGLTARIEGLRSRIASRLPTLQLTAGQIGEQRAAVQGLADGRTRLPVSPLEPQDVVGRERKLQTLYQQAKARLAEMLKMAAGKEAARAEDARDRADIADAEKRAVELRREHWRQAALDPLGCLKWTE